MKRLSATVVGLLLVAGLAFLGCSPEVTERGDGGWITLLDGANPKTLENWNRIGDANWRAEDGAIVADKGKGGYLISKNSYKDFQIRAEFWADHTTNSGIFFRISDPKAIGSKTAYEANIYDQRPEAEGGTGAIFLRCRKPAVNGIPTRSRPRALISHWFSTAPKLSTFSTASSRRDRSHFNSAIVKKEPPAARSNGASCKFVHFKMSHPLLCLRM